MSLVFLQMQKQSWKDRYIRALVTLSGAWGGSVKAVKVFAVGGFHAGLARFMHLEDIFSPSFFYIYKTDTLIRCCLRLLLTLSFLSGDDLGSYVLRESILREMQITSPSLSWLLPSSLFWKSSEVLVQTGSRNYTVNDLEDFFMQVDTSYV